MSRPAGVQIRRWFLLLVGLLLVTNAGALTASWLVGRSVRAATEEAQPLLGATVAIRAEILAAQRDLFRYLAELAPDVAPALSRLDNLGKLLERARGLHGAGGFRAELDEIARAAERYRKVLEILPRSVEGARDWNRIEEYGTMAVRLGTEVEKRADRLASLALERIRSNGAAAARLATGVWWASLGALGVGVLTVLALVRWWHRFQDTILGL